MDTLEPPEDEPQADANAWMATFADMMTLLLTFFVLLLSFANMDVTKFRMVLGSVKDALGVKYKHPGDMEGVSTHAIEFSERESGSGPVIFESDAAFQKMKTILHEEGLDGMVELEADVRGIIVRVKGRVLYGLGSATLRREASAVLDGIGKVARAVPTPLLIEGHTDDRPIKTAHFASNWELSTARAISAMRYLVAKNNIKATRIGVTGYADMRPLVANTSRQNRRRNRRVEFVFVRRVNKKQRLVEDQGQHVQVPSSPPGGTAAARDDASKTPVVPRFVDDFAEQVQRSSVAPDADRQK